MRLSTLDGTGKILVLFEEKGGRISIRVALMTIAI